MPLRHSAIALLLVLAATPHLSAGPPARPLAGGYAVVAEDQEPQVQKAVELAIKEASAKSPVQKPEIKVIKVERQVVAGLNFRITLRFNDPSGDAAKSRKAVAVVYQDLKGTLSLTSLEWPAEPQ